MEAGANLGFTVGIDLGGTSREVLDELLHWNCNAFVFHNPISRATFHPKIYLFESATEATLFIGSNNLTDGGFYSNYEATTRFDFDLPVDALEYARVREPLAAFLEPHGPTVQRLDAGLIQTLVDRGELPADAEIRRRRREQRGVRRRPGEIPVNPFAPAATPFPPLLPEELRRREPVREPINQGQAAPEIIPPQPGAVAPIPRVLVWRKTLPQTDALQVNEGSNPVGGVRLTQALFENPLGRRIDQTTYFREIFDDYPWEAEGNRPDQQHTFVPMRIVIRDRDYGVRNFEISHKPSGEAGQANYTTILKWGREFAPTVRQENLTGTVLSIYETPEGPADFLIDITNA